MTSAETAIIILNWNGARLLTACLSALARQSYRDFDLWLVDNGSIDGSSALLDDLQSSSHPSWLGHPLPRAVHVIRNAENLGFAEGNNQAIRLAGSRYIVTLNNDAIAEPDWLRELVETARGGEASLGMVASTMLFSHLDGVVASAGISVHRDGVALDRGVGKRSALLKEHGTVPVFGPSAGAALYKAALLRDVGLFDPRFFSYLEDADLAWRARSRGWRAVHNPRAQVLHEYSATGGHNSPFKSRHLARNRVWLLYKNMPTILLAEFAPFILRYDMLALLNAALTRNIHSMRGRREAVLSLPHLAETRRKTLSSSRVHPEEMREMLAPALAPARMLKYRACLDSLLLQR